MKAGIFDLDGVVTNTAQIHFKAWKKTFDTYLHFYAKQTSQPFIPFTQQDYLLYVDGKPRLRGIESFFRSRQLNVPKGLPEDDSTKETIFGLAKQKQQTFLDLLNQDGIPLFNSTIAFIHQLHQHHIKTAVVSSSKNCKMILYKTGLEDLFEARVDGLVLKELGLAGKPKPDMFLEAAKRIHVQPEDAFIVEDALSGIRAGVAGGFALVIGIDRKGTMKSIFYENGADIVIHDMSEISLAAIEKQVKKNV